MNARAEQVAAKATNAYTHESIMAKEIDLFFLSLEKKLKYAWIGQTNEKANLIKELQMRPK